MDCTITPRAGVEGQWEIRNADGGGVDFGTLFECQEAWCEPLAGYSLRMVPMQDGRGWECFSRNDDDGVWYSGAWWVLEVNREYAEREGLDGYVVEHPWMTLEEALAWLESEVGVPCIAVQVGEREIRLHDPADEN